MSDTFNISTMIALFCKECNRNVLYRCSECGQFKHEFNPMPKDLCVVCGQLRTVEQRDESSDDEEEFIKKGFTIWCYL